jgi:competence protein ComEA
MWSKRTAARAARALAALVLGACLAGTLPAPAHAQDKPAVVDLNTATLDDLIALPGIGAKRAQAILDARKERGGFQSVDDLLDVRGIGAANLEKLRPHLRVGRKNEPAR